MKFEKFLVVGGAGFVGSHLVDSLVLHGAEKVVVVDNMHLGSLENLAFAMRKGNVVVYREDARYSTALENIVELEKPEAVFNLAVKCLPYGFIDPEGSFLTGVEIAKNLATLLRKKKFERLVHFSSSEAYGSAKTVPMNENHPLDPTTPYGAGKAAADLLLLSYRKLFSAEVSILRPFNLYGERQNMEAYAAVIPATINYVLHGRSPIIEGDGLQTRDFTYVKDVTDAAVKMMDCDEAIGKVVNVGQGCEMNIKSVIRTICDELGFPYSRVRSKPARVSDVRRLFADVSLAKELLGYAPVVSFSEGVSRTIGYFKKILENQASSFMVLNIAEVQT